MLMTLPKFEYFSCKTLGEASALLSKYRGEAKVLAGGTDLLIKMKHKRAIPRYLVNIKRVPDLGTIRHDPEEGLRIGALTTIQAVRNAAIIKKRFTVLHEAACVLGTRQIRNLATLGGNLCNASPAAECAPALLTLDASARITGPDGERTVPLEAFFIGPDRSALQGDEILAEIQVPNPPLNAHGTYIKHSTRRIDVAIVGVAVVLTMEGDVCQDIRLALGAVGPTPMRAKKAEDALRGQRLGGEILEKAARIASEESLPIDDLRGEADYRAKMVEALVKEGIERAMG
jgi:carbon-monoxide dehydrogenase medium subunit